MVARPRPALRLEEPHKFLNGQADLPDQASERALGEFAVIGNRETAVRRVPVAEDDVAAGLMVHHIAESLERPDGLLAGYHGQLRQVGTSTVSSQMDGGIGSSCFRRLSR